MSILVGVTIHTIIKIGLLLCCEVYQNATIRGVRTDVPLFDLDGETVSAFQNTYLWFVLLRSSL